ncbi:bifunctional DNA-formamidopyrimidine glycosylase/DNA-(apurinic or apyrimidinic site) lyase [Weissella cibaria]|uniref:bifunctional DNA-formamidopyrimidine glycosylase/DNA-(apurinic or apyrimidinic site) lyase n=1 Tax=Weissella cibaria TaxID=137591 RepID=UPI00106EFA8A|nr:bifunctional DNA-formamidopyrimidine glycosylase/DNA-(apurinic or apyrimidinic site) lyase [Weissella cibaria]MBZ5941234.1 bifunctional DNA-formamidopyrimidine glycosylase/DNA-(apurinic or apyrimidinic site) lyase [Weissella cibaria]MCB5825476.1 bifunctional DNA-formamidopyrimidine glycosylase/DNA-(apurinic or apyrimidinic site) lyase [Weissella cibaria]MCB5857035.1 bifunctional DNA-formamidopyrimidine glycosylase/DNA-(apurinic or apyrimidinic site) lyase [Weissella cibaria]MCB5859294.1 bifu
MPELPEVETVRRGLTRLVVGRTVQGTAVRWEKTVDGLSPEEFDAELAGRRIEAIDRRGKYLLFRFSGGMTMVSHLRMEGAYYTVPAGTEPGKHDLVTFHLDDGIDLLYRDTRKFGRMKLVPDAEALQVAGLAKIGPEPTESTLSLAYMVAEFGKSRMHVKPFLLDQSHIAGLGNIYVDETLWQSKIHPLTPANKLSEDELAVLRDNIIAELARATEHHGTTVHSFTTAFGEAGEFQNELQVYGRVSEPCLRCGHPLEKMKVAQRGTTFCPVCQVEKD